MAEKLKLPPKTATQKEKEQAFTSFLTEPIEEIIKLPDNIRSDWNDLSNIVKPRKTTVEYPGWDDIIKTGPDVIPSKEQKKKMKEWRKRAKDAGFEAMRFDRFKIREAERRIGRMPLTDEEFEGSKKRQERALRMIRSPTPKTIQTVGSLLTWMDDIQDGLVTTAYLYRVGHMALKKIAPKIALRVGVPGLGYVLLAKDLFDIAKWLKNTQFLRGRGKRQLAQILDALPMGKKLKLSKLGKLRKILPSLREAIQIAQTAETVTGYGLSLGAVVGAGMDTVFGAVRGSESRGWAKYFRRDRMFDSKIKSYKEKVKSPRLTITSIECMNTLNTASLIMPYAEDFSFEDNLLILTAVHQAAAYLAESQDLQDWDKWAEPLLDEPEPRPVISEDVLDDLLDAGFEVTAEGQFPFFDGISEISPRVRNALTGTNISDAFAKWIYPHRDDPRSAYAMTLILELSTSLVKMYEGQDEPIKDEVALTFRPLHALVEQGLLRQTKTPPATEEAIYVQMMDILIRQQGKGLTYQQNKAILDLFYAVLPSDSEITQK